jgi:phage terminase small subunit
MPILPNAKHEAFCQSVAIGKTADEAYRLAGYKPSRQHASRLATKGDICRKSMLLQI